MIEGEEELERGDRTMDEISQRVSVKGLGGFQNFNKSFFLLI